MGKIAFVFAGQGAQYPGMGKEIYEDSPAAKAVFHMAEKIRPGTMEQCFSASKEELGRTVNTQPCLFAVDLAIAEALAALLKERGVCPQGAAGFSLGELPALAFAGAFGGTRAGAFEDGKGAFEDGKGALEGGEGAFADAAGWEQGFRLVVKRGRAMDQAAQAKEGGMAAVLKLSPETVVSLCREQDDVYPVNFNGPAQTVVAGGKDALKAFAQRVKAEKGLAVPLAVSGAFHSPYMEQAFSQLAGALEDAHYTQASIDVYANVDAKPYPADGGEAKARIAAQVKSPVQWQKTVENMAARGFDTFVEVGPGKTLSGLIKKILPAAAVYNVENAEDLHKTADALSTGRQPGRDGEKAACI